MPKVEAVPKCCNSMAQVDLSTQGIYGLKASLMRPFINDGDPLKLILKSTTIGHKNLNTILRKN